MKRFFNYGLKGILVLAFVIASHQASAAADIAIASAKVNGSNTVLVTFTNPGQNLASVDFTKWHIDVGGGGATPLTPTSAAVTSAGTPWTVTLTFTAGSFTATDTSYAASVGLYADASAVTDTNGDTNAVVGHAASIAIADGQAPTVVSVSPAASSSSQNRANPIIITFSEPMTPGTFAFTSTPSVTYTATWTSTSVVSLAHNTLNSSTSYIGSIDVATDAATVVNSVASLPYTWTFVTGTSVSNLVLGTAPVRPTATTIAINSGAATANSADVNLSLGATNATSMIVANNPFFTGSGWEPYAASKAWTLTSGNGEKYVYAKFVSSAGYESEPISATITVNTATTPSGSTTATVAQSTTPVTVTNTTTGATETTMSPGCSGGNAFNTSTGAACVNNATTANQNTSVKSYNFGTVTLKNGSKGEAVMELQRFLNAKLNLGLEVDGKLGPKTIIVIKKWQKDHDLKTDGLIGVKTKAMMNAEAAK